MTATLPEIPYFDADFRGERFRTTMRQLAAETWLADSPIAKFVLDREAGEVFLRSKQTEFPGRMVSELYGVHEGPLKEQIDRNILHLGGDTHRRLRGRVNHAFTPRAADAWRPTMRELIERVFDAAPTGRCDAVEAICKPYPALTIASVVGAPPKDAPRLAEWSNWIQRQFAFDFADHRDRIEQACSELYDYLDGLPRDTGLMGALGELEDRELVNLAVNVLVGGVDTTQSQLAQALRLFALHPDQWERLGADPDAHVADAVQAVLHHEPITPFTARVCLEDLEVRGVAFPKDTIVMVWAGATETFDIAAPPAERPMAFGAGIHYCLGANLARAELEEALRFLAPRMPGLRLDGEPQLESVQGIYGVTRLPVAWD